MAKRDSETTQRSINDNADILKAIDDEEYNVEEYDTTMVGFGLL